MEWTKHGNLVQQGGNVEWEICVHGLRVAWNTCMCENFWLRRTCISVVIYKQSQSKVRDNITKHWKRTTNMSMCKSRYQRYC
jgi:hypothetical protein